ncbi:MAG: GntR family transcriptional regulator [Acidobacteria bacterium]|nr:GntR family transcriptional regulator [Acidobacteriota bacterium]
MPVHRERASDAAYQSLLQAIMTQVFLPGERLNVLDLARSLNVSLTPVKEALNKLASEGLVEIRPRSGTFVTDISPEDVAETFELRAALEVVAGEKAMGRLNGDELDRLERMLAILERPMVTEGDRIAHERTNSDFHRYIVERSGNRRLIQLYESLNAHIKIARIHRSHDRWASRLAEEKAEHREIVDALKGRDAGRLRGALMQHIGRAAENLIEDLRRAVRPHAPGSGGRDQ